MSRSKLVGGLNPEKYEFVSWDDYSQYMENKTCSKPPTRKKKRGIHLAKISNDEIIRRCWMICTCPPHPLSYRLVSTFCSEDVDTEDLKSPISREIFEPAKIIHGTHIYIYMYIYMYVCVCVNLFHCMTCFEQPLQVPEMLQDMSNECVSGVFWI
jgi:hypothetical protein